MALLSAKVGSIEDNRLGGWYSYRASKAALNMLVKTAAIELKRSQKNAVLLALHPGTVQSGLSQPFRGGSLARNADDAATDMLNVINQKHLINRVTFIPTMTSSYRGSRSRLFQLFRSLSDSPRRFQ